MYSEILLLYATSFSNCQTNEKEHSNILGNVNIPRCVDISKCQWHITKLLCPSGANGKKVKCSAFNE